MDFNCKRIRDLTTVAVTASRVAKVFARVLRRLPLLFPRFIRPRRRSETHCCGAQNLLLACTRQILTAATPYSSLYPPPAALGNVPPAVCFAKRRSSNLDYDKNKGYPLWDIPYFWRRRRDLNSRAGITGLHP